MDIKLTYQAKDAEEFRDLVQWLEGRKPAAPATPSHSKGPFETEYNQKTGKRLKLPAGVSPEERERVARERLEAEGHSGAEFSVTPPEGEQTPPKDDGEDLF